MYRDSQSRKSGKPDIGKLKRKMKRNFTTLEESIDKLGIEDSDLTSYDSEDSSGKSHLQFHNKPE